MTTLARIARSPVTRGAFLLAALALATWAVARDWGEVSAALARIGTPLAAAALLASFAYVLASMQSWRAVLTDLGSPLDLRDAANIFLVSQVGKYLPGGVWNVVAGAELAKDRGVSRSRAAGALGMTILVSLLTGGVLAGLAAAFAPHGLPPAIRLVGLLAIPAGAALAPPVLSRVLAFGLRVARRPDAAPDFTALGVARAAAWAVVAWLLAGLQVWTLAAGLGVPPTPGTLAVAIGGFAAAWMVGFAILVLPAGLGARELVLAPVFASTLDRPSVVVLVLASRVLFTVADVIAALVPLAWRRR